jgi:beta-mannosidase
MKKYSLDGNWQLYISPGGPQAPNSPSELFASSPKPIQAVVPGNVEIDLHRNGLIPDPFKGDGIHIIRQYETCDFWYASEFELPQDFTQRPVELLCTGLDTLATIWINEMVIGEAENMLIEHKFLVTHALLPGKRNRIVIRLASVMEKARKYSYDVNLMSWEHREEGLYIRKAPHVWGWDIMPRAVSAGIWRSIILQTVPENSIDQLYLWTNSANPDHAELGFSVRFTIEGLDLAGVKLVFEGRCGESEFRYEWFPEFIADHGSIPVEKPCLWWPLGYGDPNLYHLTTRLFKENRILAEREDVIGIRKIEIKRHDKPGSSGQFETLSSPGRFDRPQESPPGFLIRVNGEPVMVKGTNWVPLDAFHSRDLERVDRAVDLAVDLGCNMIRCWGGNVYESDRFFNLCDQAGILVWQDCAFACCIYPQVEEFYARVRQEIQAVALRLRNHPSLALWCGDNENDMAYKYSGLDPNTNRLNRQVIPEVLHRCDPFRTYIPSSPNIPVSLEKFNDVFSVTPEQHLWGPRGYFKSPFYTSHTANFIGEIGYHGCPEPASLRQFLSPGSVWPWQENPEWQIHAVYHWQHQAIDRDRIQLMANQVREYFGEIPTDLENFALASQITQAEAKKFFVESTRLRKWGTSGILWWNLIDGWPQFSDSVVDYFWRKKLAYHYLFRVQRPVCGMVGEAGSGKYLPVVVGNDSRQPANGKLWIMDGETQEKLFESDFSVPANQNWQVGKLRIFAGEKRLYLLYWELVEREERYLFGNHAISGTPPFDLEKYKFWLSQIKALPRKCEILGGEQ